MPSLPHKNDLPINFLSVKNSTDNTLKNLNTNDVTQIF